MKFRGILMLGLMVTFSAGAQYALKDGFITLKKENTQILSFTYKNLRIYPLIAGDSFRAAHREIGNYTNLQKALTENKIQITEAGVTGNTNQTSQYQGSGESVNTLYIENISDDTVFIMAGEIVKGGKQDRLLAKDMILPPHSGKMDISVFCVESGRWNYGGQKQGFGTYYTLSTSKVRYKAVKEKSQYAVWEAVDQTTKANGATSSTKTYTALQNSETFKTTLNEYISYFEQTLKSLENCIGFVGVSGDTIIGCDLFATPELFRDQMTALLNSYITEAITNGKEVTLDEQRVIAYLTRFLTEDANQDTNIDNMGAQYKYKNKKLHINTF